MRNCTKNSSNWSSLIRNFITQGSPKQALIIYTQVRRNRSFVLGIIPLLLKACASLSLIQYGKALHCESIKAGVEFDVMLGSSLINLYAKCGDFVDARKLFDYMPDRNVVTWNSMIGGYMRNGDTKNAFLLFERMSTRTSVSWIAMIDGYARRGETVIARKFFDKASTEMRDVVTWTVMVDGYASNGEMDAAREVFEEMPQRNFFVWSTMISGYFKKGDVKEAKAIFDRIPARNLVNWNSLISGYTQNGLCEDALDAFMRMRADGFEPDEVTLACVLSACAQLGSLDAGKEIHQMILRKRLKLNQFILNGLVDMYAKCGDLINARAIFEGISQKNESCWNAMISGFAIHGQCKEAIEFFDKMEKSNEKPNEITFLSVLSACAHGGFVQEGLETFSKMEKHGITANLKHYGCLVDLLGRAGRLVEAYDLIKGMRVKPNDTILGALLGACRIYSNTDMVDRVVEEVGKVDCDEGCGVDSHYVLLSNIYKASERWEAAERMRMVMSNKGFQKTPGSSSVMLNTTAR